MILEHFGYNHKLQIDDDYLVSQEEKELDQKENWENLELSKVSISFLTNIFKRFQNKQKKLDKSSLDEIFIPIKDGCPFELEKEIKSQKDCNYEEWIGLW